MSLIDRTIDLNPGETKNDEARKVTCTTEVGAYLQVLVSGQKPGDYVFTRETVAGYAIFATIGGRLLRPGRRPCALSNLQGRKRTNLLPS